VVQPGQPREPLVPYEPQPGQVAVRWLGQGGFAFRSPNGVVWCVDPYLSTFGSRGPVERLAPPPVLGRDTQTDAVLCTHAHGDHTDPITLPEIAHASPSARFYAAAEGGEKMRGFGISPQRIHTVQMGDREVTIGSVGAAPSDVRADVVFASHGGDAVGFVFNIGEPPSGHYATRPFRLYVTGDTLYDPQLISETTKGVDVLCVCINGRLGNMSFEEAARLTGELGARTVIPMHFGVMPHNTIDPQLFVDALRAQAVGAEPRVLAIGQTLLLSR
jgi:L-ascorbate 6-phosphate lactonase